MDQGVIRSLKAIYRKHVARKIIQCVERNKSLPKISLLQGMQMLVSAWDAVTTKTVVNCFRKSKISVQSQNAAITDDDNPFKELEEEIENLRSVQPDLVSDTIDASSFTDVDAEVAAVQPPLSDAEIMADLLDTEDARNGDDDGDNGAFEVEDEPVECPDRN